LGRSNGVSRVWQAWHVLWAPLWPGPKNCLEKISITTKLWYCDITRRSNIVTEQERSHAIQGRNEVEWHPGQETSLVPPRLKLWSFGNKFTVLKNVHVTLLGLSGASHSHLAPPAVIRQPGNCAPLLRPWCHSSETSSFSRNKKEIGQSVLQQYKQEDISQNLQRHNEVRWRPGQEASLASPMFELEEFGKQM